MFFSSKGIKMVLNTVFFWCFWSKIFDREQQQQQQQQQQEEHMTPCNLGAGGPCRGAAWIRTKKQHWKIIHHRTCYAKCVCHWVESVLEENNMSSLLIRTLRNNNFTQRIIEWPGSLPQCLSNSAPTVTSTKHWFCYQNPGYLHV